MLAVSLRRCAATSTSVAARARCWSGTTIANEALGFFSGVVDGRAGRSAFSSGAGAAVRAKAGVRVEDFPRDRAVPELLVARYGAAVAPADLSVAEQYAVVGAGSRLSPCPRMPRAAGS